MTPTMTFEEYEVGHRDSRVASGYFRVGFDHRRPNHPWAAQFRGPNNLVLYQGPRRATEIEALRDAYEYEMGLVTTTPRTTRPYDTTTLDSFEPKGRRRPSVKAGRSKRRTPRDTRPKPHYVYVVLEMRPDGILGMVKGGITEVAIGHSRHGEIRRNGYDPIRVAVIEVPSKRQARAVERELLKELHALPDFGPSYGKEAVFPMWDMTFEEAQALVLAAFHLATADH